MTATDGKLWACPWCQEIRTVHHGGPGGRPKYCDQCGINLLPAGTEHQNEAWGHPHLGPCPKCEKTIRLWEDPQKPGERRPNFCEHCGFTLTPSARQQRELDYSWDPESVLRDLDRILAPEGVEQVIDKISADLDLPYEITRAKIIEWAKRQP